MRSIGLIGLGLLSAPALADTRIYTNIQLPLHTQTTINKTVTINAPPGTTVVYGEVVPTPVYPAYYYRPAQQAPTMPGVRRWEERPLISVNVWPREVYRLEDGVTSGSVQQEYEYRGYGY